jgi:hypothetical protein
MNLFEKATRKAYRFPTLKGEMTVEQLWQLPLTARGINTVDLDTVARTINNELKALGEESFVIKGTNPKRGELTDKLDIVKYIIEVKQTEASDAEKRVARQQERQKLQELLAKKNDQELEGLSKEEIEKKLAALDD